MTPLKLALLTLCIGTAMAAAQPTELQYIAAAPITANRIVSFVVGTSTVTPHVGTGNALGIAQASVVTGASVAVSLYGNAVCEFTGAPTLGNVATLSGDKCTDSGQTVFSAISTSLGAFGRVLAAAPNTCALCYMVVLIAPANNGRQIQSSELNGNYATSAVANGDGTMTYTWANGTTTISTGDTRGSVPAGTIILSLTACSTGFSEVVALNGVTVIGTLAANANVGTTGGSDTLTAAGTVAAPTFTGSAATSTAVSGGTPAGTVAAPTFTGSAATSTAVSGGTPAGTNSAPTFTGSALGTHNHTISGSTAAITAGTPSGTVGAIAATATAALTSAAAAGQNTANNTHTHPAPTFTGNALGTHLHGVGTLVNGAITAGTPAGTNSAPAFTGSALGTHTHNTTATGTNSAPAFTGSALGTHTHDVTATGTNSAPLFTGAGGDNRSAFVRVIFCSKN